MKKNQLLFLLLLVCAFGIKAQESLFDDSVIHEIRITSPDTNLWQNIDDDYNIFYPDVPYRDVTIEIDGTTIASVGLKQKGFSSNFLIDTTKKPMKIDFAEFVDDQRYDGVKKLNLMNGVGDPAIAKDKLAYDMFRQHGIPSPRVAHVKVFIQDEYWGTYAMIEQIDKRYLKRNFADNDGNLWKNKGNSNLTWEGPNPESYTFELQTNEEENDWSKFIEFVDVINNSSNAEFKTALEDIFHIDEYLRILAIDLSINNWDSYVDHGRNWYLYHEPKSNKIHWLPWDYNFAFDRDPTNGEGDLNILNEGFQKILIDRVLNVPEWKEKYLNYMCEILQVNMTSERLEPKLTQQLDLIDDDWNSTNNFFTSEDIDEAINSEIWFGGLGLENFQGLKSF
jgi:spore coat protein H